MWNSETTTCLLSAVMKVKPWVKREGVKPVTLYDEVAAKMRAAGHQFATGTLCAMRMNNLRGWAHAAANTGEQRRFPGAEITEAELTIIMPMLNAVVEKFNAHSSRKRHRSAIVCPCCACNCYENIDLSIITPLNSFYMT